LVSRCRRRHNRHLSASCGAPTLTRRPEPRDVRFGSDRCPMTTYRIFLCPPNLSQTSPAPDCQRDLPPQPSRLPVAISAQGLSAVGNGLLPLSAVDGLRAVDPVDRRASPLRPGTSWAPTKSVSSDYRHPKREDDAGWWPERLRRGQKGDGPKTPHSRRYHGVSTRRSRPSR